MFSIRQFIRLFSPPILLNMVQRLKYGSHVVFSGVYNSFDEVLDESPWTGKNWLDLSKQKLLRVLNNPDHFVSEYHTIIVQLINTVYGSSQCRVLDFAGGTGFTYYSIRHSLININNLTWDVCDNGVLSDLGKQLSGADKSLHYYTDIDYSTTYDIVFINTSLQYIEDFSGLLKSLSKTKPRFFVFTRLLSGYYKTFVSSQNIHGKTTPLIFINFDDLVACLSNLGFDLILKSVCGEENLEGRYAKNIPINMRTKNSLNVCFECRIG